MLELKFASKLKYYCRRAWGWWTIRKKQRADEQERRRKAWEDMPYYIYIKNFQDGANWEREECAQLVEEAGKKDEDRMVRAFSVIIAAEIRRRGHV